MIKVLSARPVKWLRWSTVVAIIFYLFFIGVVLNSTVGSINKLVYSKKDTLTSKSVKDTHTHNGALVEKTSERLEPETVILAGGSIDEKQILEKAFRSADVNKDSYLAIQELAKYINRKIIEHIDWAIRMNPIEFSKVDKDPGDGLITWEEYHTYFLKEHGLDDKDIKEHSEAKHTLLDRKAKEEMMRDKARWSEAARTDLFSLTLDEFLAFRHPESSTANLLSLVDDLLRLFDTDGDDQLSMVEFSDVTMDDDDDADIYRRSVISRTVEERQEEFKRIIDKNNDARADRGELLNYVNPQHPRYAVQEAATLISLTDEDKDGKLSLREMLNNAKIFLQSKMIDTANSFHEEF